KERALDDRVEIREIHRALASPGGMPQVRVPQTDDQIEEEEGQEECLNRQKITAFVPPFLMKLVALVVGQEPADYKQQNEEACQGHAHIGNAQRPAQPGQIAKEHEP